MNIEFGIKNLEGKIVYKEPFTFEENNTSFLLTFNPRELKPGNYLAYSNINLEHGKYISTKEIKIYSVNKKTSTDIPITEKDIQILPTEEPEPYKNTSIIFKQTKPHFNPEKAKLK